MLLHKYTHCLLRQHIHQTYALCLGTWNCRLGLKHEGHGSTSKSHSLLQVWTYEMLAGTVKPVQGLILKPIRFLESFRSRKAAF